MNKNGFQQLLCMEHLSALCSKETYLSEFVSLAKNLGTDYKRIMQVSKLLSKSGHSYVLDDVQIHKCIIDKDITCDYLCNKYDIQEVCKACKDSSTYSLKHIAFEKDLLSYCLADISYFAKVDCYINQFPLNIDPLPIIFSSYTNLDQSYESILYKPLNYYLYLFLHSQDKYPDNTSDLINKFLGYLPTCFQISNNWFIDIVEKYMNSLLETSMANRNETYYLSEEAYDTYCHSIAELLTPYVVSTSTSQDAAYDKKMGNNPEDVNAMENVIFHSPTDSSSTSSPEPHISTKESNNEQSHVKKKETPSLAISERINSIIGPDGYLINNLKSSDFDFITIVNTEDYVRQFDFDVLKTDTLSVEYVVYNRNAGLLIYVPTSKIYYFIDLKNTSAVIPSILQIINYYFSEDQTKIKLSAYTESLYKYLDSFNIKANSKLYSLITYHYISNPDLNTDKLYDVLAKGTNLYLQDDCPLLLQIMSYYVPVYKKYIKRLTVRQLTYLHQLSEVSHVLSRSLYLDKHYSYKDKYLKRDFISYLFSYDQITPLLSVKRTPAVLLTILVDAAPLYEYTPELLFQNICVMLFEGRFFFKYDIVVLNMDSNRFSLYIPGTAYRMVYTAINRWIEELNTDLYNNTAVTTILTEDIKELSKLK